MLNFSAIAAHELDKKGVLPEKYNDIACRPKEYPWYAKYAIVQDGDYGFLRLFSKDKSWSEDIKREISARYKAAGSVSLISAFTSPRSCRYKNAGDLCGVTLESNQESYYSYFDSSANLCCQELLGSQTSATVTLPDKNSRIWVRVDIIARNEYGNEVAQIQYSYDGVNWTYAWGCILYRYWSVYSMFAYVRVKPGEVLYPNDTKLVFGDDVLFDGSKSQRIS